MPLIGQTGEPWNVLREKAGLAAGLNTYVETKTGFDQNFPPPPLPREPQPEPEPDINRISAGRRIVPDLAKYIIDHSVGDRVRMPRP